jgi:glutaredoxin-like protein NrdH
LNVTEQRRVKMNDCDVMIYALSTCSHCKNTKEFLNGCGVEYKCIDVDKLDGEERQKIIEEVKQYNPRCSFPTIIIRDKVIVGFRQDEIKEALNL